MKFRWVLSNWPDYFTASSWLVKGKKCASLKYMYNPFKFKYFRFKIIIKTVFLLFLSASDFLYLNLVSGTNMELNITEGNQSLDFGDLVVCLLTYLLTYSPLDKIT